MKVINIFGSPGTGKSTSASFLFYELKKRNYNCELVTEVAKDFVYDKNQIALETQMYVAGKLAYRLARLENSGIDIAICDAPLLLQPIYYKLNNCPCQEQFEQIIYEMFNKYENLNYKLNFINGEFHKEGRIHTKEQSSWLDILIKGYLLKYDINYKEIDQNNLDKMLQDVLKQLHQND